MPKLSLREYLFYEKITVTDFAKKFGVSRWWMNRIVLGYHKPNPWLAMQIEKETGGEILAKDLVETQEKKSRKKKKS